MKGVVLMAVIALIGLNELFDKASRTTNSGAATRRGQSHYRSGDYKTSAAMFAQAESIRSSAETQFNRGTSEVAAGNQTEGSDLLTRALSEPSLQSRAFYNRGNSALLANAHDRAIRDYSEVLRLDSNDKAAKRNLEIALRQQEQKQNQRKSSGENQQQQQPQPSGTPQPTPPPQQGKDSDAESLLRSVEQQEREELSRMRKARSAPGKIGW